MRAVWTKKERVVLSRLSTPRKLQDYLDALAYNTGPRPFLPREVLRHRKAQCLDGAIFAAAAFRHHGKPPLLLDLRAVRDDDHVLAVFRRRGHWGAVAKSNFVGLRFREPVFRTLRDLVMSYFENYYNLEGEKALREYSVTLNLARLDHLDWLNDPAALDVIAEHLDTIRHHRLLSKAMIADLSRVDDRFYRAGMMGTVMKGVCGHEAGRTRR